MVGLICRVRRDAPGAAIEPAFMVRHDAPYVLHTGIGVAEEADGVV